MSVNLNSAFERHVLKLLLVLTPRARSIIKRRYGLGEAKRLTLEAIGSKEGITRERVRQIENDAIRKLKASDVFLAMAPYEAVVAEVINRSGGVVAENTFLAMPEFSQVKDKRSLSFFLDLAGSVQKCKTDDNFYARRFTNDAPIEKIESAVLALARDLKESNATLSIADLHERLRAQLKGVGIENLKPTALSVYSALSLHIAKNPWGEYGHIESSFIRPRGMRESAYVALARSKLPLHFRDIAKSISEFSKRPVHVQTVHNELIKDERFVLVGRGLYALREWGYEPGFVKDVVAKLLSERGALPREEILKEVSRMRQVKPSTVFINLQNKKMFKALDDGTYTLRS
jgi:hypothetical protein